MLVFQSTYDELELKYQRKCREFDKLLSQWNNLVNRINRKGGQDFLDSAVIPDAKNVKLDLVFTTDDIRKMLLLVHPDKHGGLPAANEITIKLLALKKTLK